MGVWACTDQAAAGKHAPWGFWGMSWVLCLAVVACSAPPSSVRGTPADDAGSDKGADTHSEQRPKAQAHKESEVSRRPLPVSADDPSSKAVEVLLKPQKRAAESLSVIPGVTVLRGCAGRWKLFSAVFTHTETGKERRLDLMAPTEGASAQTLIVKGQGITGLQLRAIVKTPGANAYCAAYAVAYAEPKVRDVFTDFNGPGGERLPWDTHGPRVKDNRLAFFTQRGMRLVTIDFEGDGRVRVQFSSPRPR